MDAFEAQLAKMGNQNKQDRDGYIFSYFTLNYFFNELYHLYLIRYNLSSVSKKKVNKFSCML